MPFQGAGDVAKGKSQTRAIQNVLVIRMLAAVAGAPQVNDHTAPFPRLVTRCLTPPKFQHHIPGMRQLAILERFESRLTLVLGGGLPLGSDILTLSIVNCKKSMVLEQQNENVREKA